MMESIGVILYKMFCETDRELNNYSDDDGWDSLDESMQQVWESLAEALSAQGWSP